jgi:formiminotetrahydrofolate cyclodeaminase
MAAHAGHSSSPYVTVFKKEKNDPMDQNIKAFLRVLDATDNSTGGGTASSVAGAMAAGLAAMVARLSKGKKGLAPPEHYQSIAAEAEKLSAELFDGGYEDAAAFDRVATAYQMPGDTADAKELRDRTIQSAMIHAAEVPLSNADRCRRVLNLCRNLEGSFNTHAASDLECALYLATAGLKGCAANVKINLPYIKDERIGEDIKGRLELIFKDHLQKS